MNLYRMHMKSGLYTYVAARNRQQAKGLLRPRVVLKVECIPAGEEVSLSKHMLGTVCTMTMTAAEWATVDVPKVVADRIDPRLAKGGGA